MVQIWLHLFYNNDYVHYNDTETEGLTSFKKKNEIDKNTSVSHPMVQAHRTQAKTEPETKHQDHGQTCERKRRHNA